MERPQNKNLKRGGPGRKKGSQNAKTKAAREVALGIVGPAEYIALLATRVKAGKAAHMEVVLWEYAYGKPSGHQVVDLNLPSSLKISLETEKTKRNKTRT